MSETWTEAVTRLEKEIVEHMLQVAYLKAFAATYNASQNAFDLINLIDVEDEMEVYISKATEAAMQVIRYRSKAYEEML